MSADSVSAPITWKTQNELSNADWEALEMKREADRLREQVAREIARCRERLNQAERDLNRPSGGDWYSGNVLGNAATDLDVAAAQYAVAVRMANDLLRSLGRDFRMTHPAPGEEAVALCKWLRVLLELPALPSVIIYSCREPGKKRRWVVAVGERSKVVASYLVKNLAEERGVSESKAQGGLQVIVEEN